MPRFKAIEVRWLQRLRGNAARGDRRGDGHTCAAGRQRHRDRAQVPAREEPTIPDECVRDVIEIEQGYLPGERINERLRRECHADGTIRLRRTLKTGHGLVRTEIEEDDLTRAVRCVVADDRRAAGPKAAHKGVDRNTCSRSTCSSIERSCSLRWKSNDRRPGRPPALGARRARRRGHRRLVVLRTRSSHSPTRRSFIPKSMGRAAYERPDCNRRVECLPRGGEAGTGRCSGGPRRSRC